MSKEKVSRAGEAKTNIKFLTVTAIFIALTYVFTAFLNVRLMAVGNGAMVHLGDIPLFVSAIIFGKKTGAIVGSVGMGLSDLLSGWAVWAPFTVVIVGLMGFLVGLITEKHHGFLAKAAAMIAACVITVSGYYLAEGLLYGNWLAPMASVPGNVVQVLLAAVIVLPIIKQLDRAARKMQLK